ncbi:hypothetical protein EW146_g9457 [Bondarzewia mesenterica]|uniref:Reverse transcriptase Ty1/copia-type domain-containing protein n=1 Tax=Bondarzewia mesenterica TaxID=1095465 RepID=A0A4S4L805_9AGAM|nr:hypothetical protein EW146_g9457 [Bondarzewia mesenterica]
MIKFGFSHLSAEWSIYYHNSPTGRSLVVVHVDDMNVAASNSAKITRIKEELCTEFEIVELRPVRWLVGLSIHRDRTTCTIGISQTGLINNIIS